MFRFLAHRYTTIPRDSSFVALTNMQAMLFGARRKFSSFASLTHLLSGFKRMMFARHSWTLNFESKWCHSTPCRQIVSGRTNCIKMTNPFNFSAVKFLNAICRINLFHNEIFQSIFSNSIVKRIILSLCGMFMSIHAFLQKLSRLADVLFSIY